MNSSNKARIILYLGFVISLLWSITLMAEEKRSVTLSQSVPALRNVERAFFVLSDDQRVLAVGPATYIESHETQGGTIVGRLPVSTVNVPMRVLVVALGSQGEIWSSYREFHFEDLPPSIALSTGELRDRFVERRGVFRDLQVSVTAQGEKLSELQEDADAIANVNKIVSVEDELGEIKASIQRVAAAQSNIQNRLAQMKARPIPPNAQAREAELARQLGDLSKALTVTETNALKKISTATTDLQQKLRLIDETRDEHIDLLEQELAELKRRRRKG